MCKCYVNISWTGLMLHIFGVVNVEVILYPNGVSVRKGYLQLNFVCICSSLYLFWYLSYLTFMGKNEMHHCTQENMGSVECAGGGMFGTTKASTLVWLKNQPVICRNTLASTSWLVCIGLSSIVAFWDMVLWRDTYSYCSKLECVHHHFTTWMLKSAKVLNFHNHLCWEMRSFSRM